MAGTIDISIVSSGANLADARLHRLTRALLREGLSVEIFAPGLHRDAPKIINGDSKLVIRKPLFSSHWAPTNLIARYFRSRYFVLRSHGKVIYAISPEAIAPTYGWSKLFRKKFAVDLFEDYLSLLKDRAWTKKLFGLPGFIAISDTKSALWFAARADLLTVADVQVPPFEAKNRLVVRNLPDRSLLTPSGEMDETPRAVYIGDLRKSRGLHAMLEIAAAAPDWEFDFVGEVAQSDLAFVQNWLEEHGEPILVAGRNVGAHAARIRFHGKLAPAESWKYAAGAWVGLSLLESTPAFIAAVPSKIYEYLAVGLATLTTPLPRCIELVEKSGGGKVVASTEAAAKTLKEWSKNPQELREIRSSALEWATVHLDSDSEYATFAGWMANLTR